MFSSFKVIEYTITLEQPLTEDDGRPVDIRDTQAQK